MKHGDGWPRPVRMTLGVLLILGLVTISQIALTARSNSDSLVPEVATIVRSHDQVKAVVSENGYVVAILLDPSHVRMCSAVLALWKDWATQEPEQVQVLFTRQPTLLEARQLAIHRVRGTVLHFPEDLPAADVHSPTEFFVTEDRVWSWRLGTLPTETSRLLAYLKSSPEQTFRHVTATLDAVGHEPVFPPEDTGGAGILASERR